MKEGLFEPSAAGFSFVETSSITVTVVGREYESV